MSDATQMQQRVRYTYLYIEKNTRMFSQLKIAKEIMWNEYKRRI